METQYWWKKPIRIIQFNLQVADTPKMKPSRIAESLKEMAANVAVFNVGGIYAWYPSKIKYHHVNEYLPKEYDLLQSLIDECHKRNIKFVARFDFSKADDVVYLQKPQWFVKDINNQPLIYGKERMGEWSLLISTCINGGYRNEEFAIPVLEEVLNKYDIDGIFFNAPHAEECYCELCKEKYLAYYNKELPVNRAEIEVDWKSRCLKDNIGKLYDKIKKIKPDIPVILYYSTFHKDYDVNIESLDDRYATADLICTEAQDVLSSGLNQLDPLWKPAMNMKIGRVIEEYPKPLGIIHSCPGMDWRHTGLPTAEYLFWMSQIVANGGYLWHSLTGFNDTITDKRVLQNVSKINRMIQKCEAYMENAQSLAQVLLLWDGSRSALGWVEGMINTQHQFDLMDIYHMDYDKMSKYPIVIVPDDFNLDDSIISLLERYVFNGGNLIMESTKIDKVKKIKELSGIEDAIAESPELSASYIRMETDNILLRKDIEDTELLPLRGNVLYTTPRNGTKTLMTLVPPFAPLDGVGAPPERASLPVAHTEIPLAIQQRYGNGQTLFIPFSLSRLIWNYHLADHYYLLRNFLDYLLQEEKVFSMDTVYGLQACVYKNDDQLMIHLINGIGQRPLVTNIPYYNLNLKIRWTEASKVKKVISIIGNEEVSYKIEGDYIYCKLKKLEVWDMLLINAKEN